MSERKVILGDDPLPDPPKPAPVVPTPANGGAETDPYNLELDRLGVNRFMTWDEEIELGAYSTRSAREMMEAIGSDLIQRDEMVARYSWAIPTAEAVSAIASLPGPIIEWCAGLGYWTHLIRAAGADISAFTDRPGTQALRRDRKEATPIMHDPWTQVNQSPGGPEDVRRVMQGQGWSTLLLIWPPYADRIAADCLKDFGGRCVAYVGEFGGCTADDEFHGLLEELWREERTVRIPSWRGIRDNLYIFQRD